MRDAYIGRTSENNNKCVVHDNLRQNWTTGYIVPRHWLYKWFSQFHSCETLFSSFTEPSITYKKRSHYVCMMYNVQFLYIQLKTCKALRNPTILQDKWSTTFFNMNAASGDKFALPTAVNPLTWRHSLTWNAAMDSYLLYLQYALYVFLR